MRTLLALAACTISSMALAAPIAFDLRDPTIEANDDEINSFSLTQHSLTATLTAQPSTLNEPPMRTVVLNQTSASYVANGSIAEGAHARGKRYGGPRQLAAPT